MRSRRPGATLFLIAIMILLFPVSALAQRAVILVRHAEKADESKDPPLSRAGAARAESLARHLRDAGVTAILTSEYLRSVKTAEPIARSLGITPAIVPARNTNDLVALLRGKHRDDVVLVVGHSNTVPDVLKGLGHAGEVVIPDGEYDSLFVLVPRGAGPPALLRLRY